MGEDDDRFAARVIYVPPKNPEWEAIGLPEIDRRIRAVVSDAPERAYELLSVAVAMSVPLPSDMGTPIGNAIAALEKLFAAFEKTAVDKESFPIFDELKSGTFTYIGNLQSLRDRMYRVCDHEERIGQGSSSRCRDCEVSWDEGKDRPARMTLSRAHSPLAVGQQRPGKVACVYLATEICRRQGLTKEEGLRVAGRLVEVFWPDGEGYDGDDDALEEAHRQGKKSAKEKRFISAEQLEEHNLWYLLGDQIIWVPHRGYAPLVKKGEGAPPVSSQ
jgi:hypothetical protein